MNYPQKVLGIIPARGGSKGVPRKNIRLLAGKPLLQYTAEAALSAKNLTRVILSSEDSEIIEVGRKCGLDVPFVRPAELAQGDTKMIDVILHSIGWFKEHNESFDAICILQPTCPTRTSETIDLCVDLLFSSQADTIITLLPVPIEFNPHWVYFQNPDGSLKISTGLDDPITIRQQFPPAFHREGSVYVSTMDTIVNKKSIYGSRIVGCLVDPKRSVNIDSLEDWNRAEEIIQKNMKK